MAERTDNLIVHNLNKPPKNYYMTYLNLMLAGTDNVLTQTEKDILEECYFSPESRLTTDSRRQIAKNMGISPSNLTNYVKKLRDKKYITEDGRLTKVLTNPIFKTLKTRDPIQIRFTLFSEATKAISQRRRQGVMG